MRPLLLTLLLVLTPLMVYAEAQRSDRIETVCGPPMNCTPNVQGSEGSRTLHYPLGLLDCYHKMKEAMQDMDTAIRKPQTGDSHPLTWMAMIDHAEWEQWEATKKDCWSHP